MRASGTWATTINGRRRRHVEHVNRLVRSGVTAHAEVMYAPFVVASLRARTCRGTADLVEQGLDARARRLEIFVRDGHIISNAELSFLPTGHDRVFGLAGSQGVSASLEVTIVTPQLETS